LAGERIVLLSTHIVSDVEAVASRIVLLGEGKVAADGTPEALVDSVRGRVWELDIRPEDLDAARRHWTVGAALRRGATMTLRVVAPEAPRPDARPLEPTLEDVYLAHFAARREAAAA